MKSLRQSGSAKKESSQELYSDHKFVVANHLEVRRVLADNFSAYIKNKHDQYKQYGADHDPPFETESYCVYEEHDQAFEVSVYVTLKSGYSHFREYLVWSEFYKEWHFTITWLAKAIKAYEQNNQKHIWVSQGVYKNPQEPLTFVEEISLIKLS